MADLDTTADAILDALAELVAERVAARLQQRPAVYSSTSLPPGITRRTFHARCRTIPEATRDGRVWRCPVDAYERALHTPAPVVPIRRGLVAIGLRRCVVLAERGDQQATEQAMRQAVRALRATRSA